MKQLLKDNIKYKSCPHCETSFIYDFNLDTYEVFGPRGCADAVRMVECPVCHKSSKEEYSSTLRYMLDLPFRGY